MRYPANSSHEVGTLLITLNHPTQAFLYRPTKPRLLVNGAEVAVSGWGTHRLQVPTGRHQVQIWVPYALPRKAGRAKAEVTVDRGEEVQLEYMAPTVTFARGSLGAPGQQRSPGFSLVMGLNVIAVVAVLAYVILAALR